MDNGCEQVLDKFAQSLQALQADHASLSANTLEHVCNSHSHVLLVESKNQFAELLFRWYDFLFCFVSDLRVENYILNALEKLLLGILHVHDFL